MMDFDAELHLYFIRHGQSERNLHPEELGGRSPETPLTALGALQAQALGRKFASEGIRFHQVHYSSLRRAVETTWNMLGQMQMPDITKETDALVEFSQGLWEGKPRKDIYTPTALLRMGQMAMDFCTPNGESQRMVERRAMGYVEDEILYNPAIAAVPGPWHIAIVSHGVTIKCLLHRILGFDSHLTWKWPLENCSISKCIFSKSGWTPVFVNDMSHRYFMDKS